MIFLLMSQNFLPVVVLPVIPHLAEAQTAIHSLPDNSLRAVIIPAGKNGNEGTESRMEMGHFNPQPWSWLEKWRIRTRIVAIPLKEPRGGLK
jgi:hypothetical protein